MKHRPIWLAAGLLIFVVLACHPGKKNANQTTNSAETKDAPNSDLTAGNVIQEIHMAKDDGNGNPGAEADAFSGSDRTIHCVVKLTEAKSQTKMTFSWWVVDADGSNNEKIKDINYTTRALENIVHSHLRLPQDWPKGRYKVEVYVNDNLEKTAGYTVD